MQSEGFYFHLEHVVLYTICEEERSIEEKMCNNSVQYVRYETLQSPMESHHSVLLLL